MQYCGYYFFLVFKLLKTSCEEKILKYIVLEALCYLSGLHICP